MNEVEGKQKNKTDQHEDFYINGTKGEKITPENCHKEEKKGFEKKKKKVKSKMRKELTDLKSTEFGTQVWYWWRRCEFPFYRQVNRLIKLIYQIFPLSDEKKK